MKSRPGDAVVIVILIVIVLSCPAALLAGDEGQDEEGRICGESELRCWTMMGLHGPGRVARIRAAGEGDLR